MRIFLVVALLLAVLPAYGSIILFSGVTGVSPPASVQIGETDLQSATTAFVFAEQQNVLITSPQDAGIVTPGTWVCCTGFAPGAITGPAFIDSYYLLSSAPTGSGVTDFTGSITFSPGERVVGIIVGYQVLASTNSMFGAPGTLYPVSNGPFFTLNGLDPGDSVTLSSNLQTVSFDFQTGAGGIDSIRILTETPEPPDYVLFGSGLIVLGLFGRRIQLRRAARQ